jgi:DNA-directed RNA polymerase specialized sigma24 family protein
VRTNKQWVTRWRHVEQLLLDGVEPGEIFYRVPIVRILTKQLVKESTGYGRSLSVEDVVRRGTLEAIQSWQPRGMRLDRWIRLRVKSRLIDLWRRSEVLDRIDTRGGFESVIYRPTPTGWEEITPDFADGRPGIYRFEREVLDDVSYRSRLGYLRDGERQVLQLWVKGWPQAAIARELGVDRKRVKGILDEGIAVLRELEDMDRETQGKLDDDEVKVKSNGHKANGRRSWTPGGWNYVPDPPEAGVINPDVNLSTYLKKSR